MLEQDNTRKGRVDEKTAEQLKFEAGSNNKEYKVKDIRDSAVYARESEIDHLLGFYYLVSWKSYSKDENTWEPVLAVKHLRKLVSIFDKNHPNNPTATSLPIDLAPPMAKCIASPNVNGKQKRGQPIGSVRKKVKH